MASNGRVESGTIKNSRFYVNWQLAYHEPASNTSVINFQVGLNCQGGNVWYTNAVKINSVVIDGQTVLSNQTYSNITGNGDNGLYGSSVRVAHNLDGSKEFNISISGWLYSFGNTSGSQNFWLDAIDKPAKILSITGENLDYEWNLEGNFRVEYNQSGYTYKLRISIPNVKELENFNYNSNTAFKLNSTSINYLLNYMGTNRQIGLGFCIETWVGSTKIGESDEWVETCNVKSYPPILSTFTYQDINVLTTNLTGNNQILIKGKSTLQFNVGQATAQKGATISDYKISIDDGIKDQPVVVGANILACGFSSDTTAYLIVTDSRGNQATKSINLTVLDYEKPNAIIDIKRKNNFYNETTIKIDAEYTELDNKNTLEVKFRYKKEKETEYNDFQIVTKDYEGVLDLDNNSSFNFQILLTDKLSVITYNILVNRGVPIAFFDMIKNSLGVGCIPQEENSIELNGGRVDTFYSYEEKVVGIWTNEKPIYKKTFEFNVSQGSVDISYLNIDEIINFSGICHKNKIIVYPLEFYRASDFYLYTSIMNVPNMQNINVDYGSDVSSYTCVITVQYTKNLDS